jgi:hypothetical protein
MAKDQDLATDALASRVWIQFQLEALVVPQVWIQFQLEALVVPQSWENQIALDAGDAERHVHMFPVWQAVERRSFAGAVSLRER